MLYSVYVQLNSLDKVRKFCELTKTFDENLYLKGDKYEIDAKSILGILSLNLMNKLKFIISTTDSNRYNEIVSTFDEFVVT
jgi:phosphotransferase system HPr-like phosphotransfer protein